MDESLTAAGGRRGQWALLALVLALCFLPRVVHLPADPPVGISPTSCGDYGDPASYAANARNKVLFGKTRVDDFNPMFGSPVGHLATLLVFRIFGPGIWQMNLQPVLFSVLLFGALFFLARRHFPEERLLFFFLLALNYPLIIYGRIANQAMPMTFFAVLGLGFFLRGWEKPAWFLASAAALGLSFMAKGKIVYFLVLVMPLVALASLVLRKEARSLALNGRRLAWFAAGTLAVLLPWIAFVYLPARDFLGDFGGINAAAMFPRTPVNLVQSWLLKPAFTFHGANRLFSLVLFLYFFWLLLRLFNKNGGRRITPLEAAGSLWFVIGVVGNSVIAYRPTRHYIEMTVPMVLLASLFLKRALAGGRIVFEPGRRPLFDAGLFVLLWLAVTSFSSVIFADSDILERPYVCLLILTGIAAAAFVVARTLIRKFLSGEGLSVPRRLAGPVVAVALCAYAGQNIVEYAGWVKNATYGMRRISRDLGRAFPPGSVFSGLEAPAISMENRNVAHVWYPGFANWRKPDFLEAMKVRFLFLADFNGEINQYRQAFPETMKRARFRVRYRLWRSWFDLYEIGDAPPAEEAETGLYEAETLDREVGLPLFDPDAGNGFAVRVETGEEGILVQKKIGLKPGEVLDGRLFVRPEVGAGPGPLLLIQLNIGRGLHYRRFVSLYDPETEAGRGFLEVPFKVALPRTRELTYNFRILALGKTALSLDRIELRVRPSGGSAGEPGKPGDGRGLSRP